MSSEVVIAPMSQFTEFIDKSARDRKRPIKQDIRASLISSLSGIVLNSEHLKYEYAEQTHSMSKKYVFPFTIPLMESR